MSSNAPNDPLAELLGSYLSGGTRGSAGNLEELFGVLTQGGAAPGQAGGATRAGGLAASLGQISPAGSPPPSGDTAGSLLGSLLGGGASTSQGAPMSSQQEAGGLGDLMGALLGGGMAPSQGPQQEAGGLGDLMGALLGGGMAPSQGAPMGSPVGSPIGSQQQAGGVGDLMGALLGGGLSGSASPLGASQGAVGIGEILGAVLGGGSAGIASSPLLAPIANFLSQKLGLPPVIAQAIVSFVLAKLMSGSSGGRAIGPAGLAQEGPAMQDLLEYTGSGQRLDTRTLAATGLPEELAQYTGLDVDTATASLQQALNLLGPAMGSLGAAQ